MQKSGSASSRTNAVVLFCWWNPGLVSVFVFCEHEAQVEVINAWEWSLVSVCPILLQGHGGRVECLGDVRAERPQFAQLQIEGLFFKRTRLPTFGMDSVFFTAQWVCCISELNPTVAPLSVSMHSPGQEPQGEGTTKVPGISGKQNQIGQLGATGELHQAPSSVPWQDSCDGAFCSLMGSRSRQLAALVLWPIGPTWCS